ncbi:MAG: hypothetical protein VYD19_08165 [Myxococcota bacterium]|nr:hypothetical protein [Myxococcota bacterium]
MARHPRTLRLGLIGEGISESLSPQLQHAIADQLEIRLSYALLDHQHFHRALEEAERRRLDGVNVTAPHKGAAARAARWRSADVAALGVSNTLSRIHGGWVAQNSDLFALCRCLKPMLVGPGGGRRPVIILGAGATTRTLLFALARLFEKSDPFTVETYERGGAGSRSLGLWLRGQSFPFILRRPRWGEWAARCEEAPLIISALPPLSERIYAPLLDALMTSRGLFFDLNYGQRARTTRAFMIRRCAYQDGLEMLVWQGLSSARSWSHRWASFDRIFPYFARESAD